MNSEVWSLINDGPIWGFLSTSQGGFLGGPLRVGVSILADLRPGSTAKTKIDGVVQFFLALVVLKLSPGVSACCLIVCA